MTCPRCMSQLFANRDGDGECVTCGCISYLTAPMPIALAKVDVLQKEAIHIGGKERDAFVKASRYHATPTASGREPLMGA